MTAVGDRVDGYRHEALPYTGSTGFAPSCSSVVLDGLAQDERMIVLAPQAKLDDVHDALGTDAEDVTLVATDSHGRNPGRLMTMLHSFQAGGDGRHSTGIKETGFAGRSAAARAEIAFADFILNDPSLQTWALSVVCLYDTEELDDDSALAMRRSHAVIRGSDGNPMYDPELGATLYGTLFEPAPDEARRMTVTSGRLAQTRVFVRTVGAGYRLTADRLDDLVLAANEVVTNSMRYGGGRAEVAVWVTDDAVACEVRDRGHITDPMVGRIAPPPSATSGRGLWLVNNVCDLVQIRSSEHGTAVRMFVDR